MSKLLKKNPKKSWSTKHIAYIQRSTLGENCLVDCFILMTFRKPIGETISGEKYNKKIKATFTQGVRNFQKFVFPNKRDHLLK